VRDGRIGRQPIHDGRSYPPGHPLVRPRSGRPPDRLAQTRLAQTFVRSAGSGQLGLTVRKQSEQYTGRSMRGLNGTCAWFPHELQTTAKYSRIGRSSPRS
jgi:hypothetical protein